MEAKDKIVVRGELALVLAVLINSFAVAVTVYAGLGISPVSSFPYAVSLVFPFLTLGTWTYLFQGVLVITLMVLRKRFVPSYLFSFVAGFFFGKLLDVFGAWLPCLPYSWGWRIFYFVASCRSSRWALHCPTGASCRSSRRICLPGTFRRLSASLTPRSRRPWT